MAVPMIPSQARSEGGNAPVRLEIEPALHTFSDVSRDPRVHDRAANIGTAASISAATAMMPERMVTLVRNSRAVMMRLLHGILGRPGVRSPDKFLTSTSSGTLTTPFAGIHGWYWENPGSTEVTVSLSAAGFYNMSYEFRKDAAPKIKMFQ